MKISPPLYEYLNKNYGPIQRIHTLSGGDISDAYQVQCSTHQLFVKTQASIQGLKMFQAEADGLAALKKANLRVPEVLEVNEIKETSFIIMPFIATRPKSKLSDEDMAEKLAYMHLQKQDEFGWESDNYIGSLSQINPISDNWIDFYAEYRLKFQLNLAVENGQLLESENLSLTHIKNTLKEYIGNVQPSLVHGDLWGGNYISDEHQKAIAIDPAVYMGHSEVDLAMSRLFGGFSSAFYQKYHAIITEEKGWQERNELYQLYYLLVHLNLFGRSYYPQVKALITKYF